MSDVSGRLPPTRSMGMGDEVEQVLAERRGSDRRQAADQTFCALRPDFTRVGRVHDVGSDGLSFEYISEDSLENHPELNLMRVLVDVFVTNDEFYLPQLPCRVVYEMTVFQGAGRVGDLRVRRCGLKFLALSSEQQALLRQFLAKYTLAED